MMNEKWNDNLVQFARLLCEVVAIQDNLDIPGLAESMDLTQEDVLVLLDRANTEWERAKGNLPPLVGPEYEAFVAGTEGQDRESYTDDQDRESYTVPQFGASMTPAGCIASGVHLQSVDDDGYCNVCGTQESAAGEQEYDVVIRNTFQATDPQHAVRQMVEYLTAYLANAEYKVERYEDESEPAQEWWVSAS